MTLQKRSNEMVELLRSDFQHRYEPQFAWKSACSLHTALTGLRGFWPMSAFGSGGGTVDLSDQNRTLTYNGSGLYYYDALAPYIYLDGDDYLERADEAGLDILGTETFVNAAARGLSMGCWVRFDAAAQATEIIMSKADGAAAANTSYSLYRIATGELRLNISDGAAAETVTSTVTLSAATWYCVGATFDPSTNRAVWVDGVEYAAGSSALAALNNTGASFQIGGRDNGAGGSTSNMTGRVSLAWLCAALLPDVTMWEIYQQTRAMFGK